MKKLIVGIIGVAAVLLILGLAVETMRFLLGVAPVLLVVAMILMLLSRFRGRRIPR